MWNLIRNEIEKMFYKKKILITLLILALMGGLMSYEYVHQNTQNEKNNRPEVRLQNAEENLRNMKQARDHSGNEKENQFLDEDIVRVQREIEDLKTRKSMDNGVDWRKTAEQSIKQMKEEKAQINPLSKEGGAENLNISINTLQYNLDHNIKPKEDFKSTGYESLQSLISAMGFIFLAIIIGVLVSDIVSGEYTPPTMKVLLTRPVSRGKVLLSKYISAIISSVLMVLSVELVCFLIVGVLYGFGNSMYPTSVGTKYKYVTNIMQPNIKNQIAIVGSTYIIPVWQFTLRIIGLQVLYIIAAASFAFLLSTILKTSMISMAVNIVVIMVVSILSTAPFAKKIAWLLFTSFGDVVGVVQKNMPGQFYGAQHFSVTNAIIVLTCWSLVSYLISHVIFIKKDILI